MLSIGSRYIEKSLKLSCRFTFVSLRAIGMKFCRHRFPAYTFPHAIIFVRCQVLVYRSSADRRADGRTLAKSFCFRLLIKNIYTCPYLSRIFLMLQPLMTKVSIPFFHFGNSYNKSSSSLSSKMGKNKCLFYNKVY